MFNSVIFEMLGRIERKIYKMKTKCQTWLNYEIKSIENILLNQAKRYDFRLMLPRNLSVADF